MDVLRYRKNHLPFNRRDLTDTAVYHTFMKLDEEKKLKARFLLWCAGMREVILDCLALPGASIAIGTSFLFGLALGLFMRAIAF